MSRPNKLFQHYLVVIRKHIQSAYAAQEHIPSYQQLADMFSISSSMAFRIVQSLTKEGLIRRDGPIKLRTGVGAGQRSGKMRIGLISSRGLGEWKKFPLYSLLAEYAQQRSMPVIDVPHAYYYRPTSERRRMQWAKVPWNEFDVGILLDVEDQESLSDPAIRKHTIISVDSDATPWGIPSVCFDDFGAGWQTAEYLLKLGHTRCGVSIQRSDRRHPWDMAWLKRRYGFESALGYSGAFFRPEWYLELDRGLEYCQLYIRRWLEAYLAWQSRDRPTALFLTNGFEQTLFEECSRLRIHVPADLSVITVIDSGQPTSDRNYRFAHLQANYSALALRTLNVAEELFESRVTPTDISPTPAQDWPRLSSVAMLLTTGNTVAAIKPAPLV